MRVGTRLRLLPLVCALVLVPLEPLTKSANAQDRNKPASLESLLERVEAVEENLRQQRHRDDILRKRIDNLMWFQLLGNTADIEIIRYTGPERHQPNPTAQNAGNALIISAYLFVPRKPDRSQKLPLLVFPHGGVHSNFSTSYATVVRELLDQGYVVIYKIYQDPPGEHSFELINTEIARQARLEVYRFLSRYLTPPNPPNRSDESK